MSNVSLYVVDLKRVQPFGMTTPRVTTVVNTGVNDLPKNVSTIKNQFSIFFFSTISNFQFNEKRIFENKYYSISRFKERINMNDAFFKKNVSFKK